MGQTMRQRMLFSEDAQTYQHLSQLLKRLQTEWQ